jgi:chitin disaccharide deacetylase
MVRPDPSPVRSLPPGLIVNADDLGIHPSINAGILSAYRNGILTSCTMLMTTAYLDETVRDYVKPAALPIGIHLSLTLGKSVAPAAQVPDIVDEAGHLKLSASRLLMLSPASDAGRQLFPQIREELNAQLALAHDVGLRATHADFHQHVHMNPAIFTVVEDLLPKYGIDRLRYCREAFPTFVSPRDLPGLIKRLNPVKWAMLRWRSAQIRPKLATNDDFFGVMYSGAMNKTVIMSAIANASQERSLEICIHPGLPAPRGEVFYPRPGYNEFISSPARRVEHDILVDAEVNALVRESGLVLRAFDGRAKC